MNTTKLQMQTRDSLAHLKTLTRSVFHSENRLAY